MMEKLLFDLDHESFVVHLVEDEQWKKGCVYPINRHLGTKEWVYQSYKDGSGLKSEEGAVCLFSFLFCWRGVWEGRIYFQDDEYWSEQLSVMSELWSKIEEVLKKKIKLQKPDQLYDE